MGHDGVVRRGRIVLSASTAGMIGHGRVALTPDSVVGFAAIFGIVAADLAALIDFDLSDDHELPPPASADAAELIWQMRRLTTDQQQQVEEHVRAMATANRSIMPLRRPGD